MSLDKTKDKKFNIHFSGKGEEAKFVMPEKDCSKKEVDLLYQKYLSSHADEDKWQLILSVPNMIMKYAKHIAILYDIFDVEYKKTEQEAFIDLCLRLFDGIDTFKPNKYKSIKNYMQQKCSSRVMCEEVACKTSTEFIEKQYGSYENAKIYLGDKISNAINEAQEADCKMESLFFLDEHKQDLKDIKYGIGEKHYNSLLKYYDGSEKTDISRQRCEQLRRNAHAILKGDMICLRNLKMQEVRQEIQEEKRSGTEIIEEIMHRHNFNRDKARYILNTTRNETENMEQ